jgi:hypothetical protein
MSSAQHLCLSGDPMKIVASLVTSLTVQFAVIAALAVPAVAQDFDSENIDMQMPAAEATAPPAAEQKKAEAKKAKAEVKKPKANKKTAKASKKNNSHNKSKGKGHKKGHGKKKTATL